jgi:hypothetical protein
MGAYLPPPTVPVVNNAPQPSDVTEEADGAAPSSELTEEQPTRAEPEPSEPASAPTEPAASPQQ